MKIGIFTDTYYPQLNGVTISIDNFTKSLRKKGHEVYIFAPKVRGYHVEEQHVFRLHSLKVLSSEPEARVPLYVPDKTMQDIFRRDLDVIHAHGNGPFSLLGYQVAKIKRLPYILTFHTLHTEYAHYFLDGKVIRPRVIAAGLKVFGNLCDGVITPSEKMKNKMQEFGVSKPIEVIPSFIDVDIYNNQQKGYLHKLLSLPSDAQILLSVGRLGKEKNFTFLIKMFKKVASSHPSSHLVIVGQGPELDALRKLTASLNLSGRVHLTGNISSQDMPRVYKDATIFVFSSTTETQGICVLEAAASGLPLVVVNDSAFANIVTHEKNGYTLPLNQTQFAQKINYLLENPEVTQGFANESRSIALKNFNEEHLTDQLLTFYKDIIEHRTNKEKIITRMNNAALLRLYRATGAIDRFLNK